MPHSNDCILANTHGLTIQDGLLKFYHARGATSGDLQDAENEFLLAQGATPAHSQDMWVEYISSILGSPDSKDFGDLWNWYWCDYDANAPITPSLVFNGTTTSVAIPITLDMTVETLISVYIEPTAVPAVGTQMAIFGVDTNFFVVVSNVVDKGPILRVSSFAELSNLPGIGNILAGIPSLVSQSYPPNALTVPGSQFTYRHNNLTDKELAGTVQPVGSTFYLGTRGGGVSDSFSGVIKNCRMYENGVLVHRWPLSEGVGTVANDVVGGATFNGVITDPTWVQP